MYRLHTEAHHFVTIWPVLLSGPKSNFGNFLVEVKDKKYTAQVEERLNKYVRENYPDILIRSSLFKLSPAVEANIEFGFIGENIDTLTMLTEKAMSIMHECDMVTDIKNSWGNKVPVWEPAYSQERGQRLGITRQAVAYALKIATNGLPLGDYREKDLFMPILLKEENIESSNIDNMKTLPVFSQSGYAVPLAQVVDSFAFGYNYNVIKRYNRDKVMMAQCDSKRGANTMAAFAAGKKSDYRGYGYPSGLPDAGLRGKRNSGRVEFGYGCQFTVDLYPDVHRVVVFV